MSRNGPTPANELRPDAVVRVGRYDVGPRIAAGGMATVHLGRVLGAAGFARVVAIKRLLPEFASDPEFEAMFVEEAQLAARIHHPNIVSTLDVVSSEGELLLVMDYVHGESLARLTAAGRVARDLPRAVALAVVCDALHGLHAAHEARDRKGEPLGIVHRDVSPQNVIVGTDGVARVIDFGIAKAATSINTTREGMVRGKVAYMAPEQLLCEPLTRRTDLYAAGVVLWELLSGERLFPSGARPELVQKVEGRVPSLRSRGVDVSPALDGIVARALAAKASERFADADEMATTIELHCQLAKRSEISEWVQRLARPALAARAALVSEVEAGGQSNAPPRLPADSGVQPAPASPFPTVPAPPLRPSTGRGQAWAVESASDAPGQAAPPPSDVDSNLSAVVRAQSRKVHLMLLGLAGGLIAVGVVLGGALFGARSSPSPSPGLPVVTALSSPSSIASSAEATHVKRAPAPSAVASVATAPGIAPSSSASSRVSRSRPRPPAVAGTSAVKRDQKARKNCDPPYRVDARGHRVFKVECF